MRILVAGTGRSGTSWVAATLGSTPSASFLLEPDNPSQYPFALRAAFGLDGSPILGPDDPGPASLRRLWDAAYGAPVGRIPGQQRVAIWLHSMSSREEQQRMMRAEDPKVSMRLRLSGALAVPRHRPHTRHRIVKSIRSHFAIEWITANWGPAVVVCRRHPLDVVASRLEVFSPPPAGIPQSKRDEAKRRYGVDAPTDNGIARSAWTVGLHMSVLEDSLRANPQFHVVDHEDLCRDPIAQFHSLATTLGLDWTAENEAAIEASNRAGTGYELNRIAADLPGSWRRRLSADDARTAAEVIAEFPIASRYDLEVSKHS